MGFSSSCLCWQQQRAALAAVSGDDGIVSTTAAGSVERHKLCEALVGHP
jgi:hypothetical protein